MTKETHSKKPSLWTTLISQISYWLQRLWSFLTHSTPSQTATQASEDSNPQSSVDTNSETTASKSITIPPHQAAPNSMATHSSTNPPPSKALKHQKPRSLTPQQTFQFRSLPSVPFAQAHTPPSYPMNFIKLLPKGALDDSPSVMKNQRKINYQRLYEIFKLENTPSIQHSSQNLIRTFIKLNQTSDFSNLSKLALYINTLEALLKGSITFPTDDKDKTLAEKFWENYLKQPAETQAALLKTLEKDLGPQSQTYSM